MTSYRVIAPVFLGRFQGPHGVFFRGWSPRRYGPAYTYDLVIESEDDQHPAMNMEYADFIKRVFLALGRDKMVDATTDFHCAVPIEERGEEGFIVTFQDGPFSPVFFLSEDAILYRDYLRYELGLTYELMVCSFSHEVV